MARLNVAFQLNQFPVVSLSSNKPASFTSPAARWRGTSRTRDVPRWLERFCRSESSLPPPPPPPGTEPPPGTSQGLSEPPSVMGRIVKSIADGCQRGIGAPRRRAVRPPGTELHKGIGRKETTLWPKDSPVVTVRKVSLSRVGACGQERNCHCRQASQKHSHGSLSVDRWSNGPGPDGYGGYRAPSLKMRRRKPNGIGRPLQASSRDDPQPLCRNRRVFGSFSARIVKIACDGSIGSEPDDPATWLNGA